ncbi:MAG TPA: PQQ-binding-like beta-propeller repeat protein, partial [Planctomycetota bacterium]|nr:PQQ-binding-like beta-propeller repeat protein [Planctomycetota bacterium]
KEKPKAGARGSSSSANVPIYAVSSPAASQRDRVVVGVQVRLGQESLQHVAALGPGGREEWPATYIGTSQGGNYLNLEGVPSPPLVDDDKVYYLTNAGWMACLDAEDGTLLWLAQYPGLNARSKREAARNEDRWEPNPVLLAGDNLLVAPQDSAYVLALAREDGRVVWRAPRQGGTVLAGADRQACYIVGREVQSIGIAGPQTGLTLWRMAPSNAGAELNVAGRSYLGKGVLYVPTRDALLTISPTEGKVTSTTLWDLTGGGGNVLQVPGAAPPSGGSNGSAAVGGVGGGVLVVAGAAGTAVYGPLSVERARVASLASGQPETPLEVAKLDLRSGDMEAGLRALREWQRGAPPTPLPNSTLDHLHLYLAETLKQLLRDGRDSATADELRKFRMLLERVPQRRVEAAIELGLAREKKGDLGGAADALHQALAYDNPATSYAPDGHLAVPSNAFIRDRLRSLRAASRDPVRDFSSIDSAARDALRRAQNKLRTLAAYQDVSRLFPFTPAAAEAYQDLARLYRDAQSYDQAAACLDSYLVDFPSVKEELRVKLFTANMLRQAGKPRESLDRFRELLERHGTSLVEGVEGARSGETVESYVKPLLADPIFLEAAEEDAPSLRFPIRMLWRSPADLHATKRTFLQPEGTPPKGLGEVFLTQAEDVIEMRDASTGLPLWRSYLELIPGFESDDPGLGRGFRLPRAGRRAFTGRYLAPDGPAGSESLLVLQDERNIFAFDPARGTVKWHVPIADEKEAKAPSEPFRLHLREKLRGASITADGIFGATTRSRLFRVSFQGEMLWTVKTSYTPAIHPLVQFEDRVFVFAQPSGIRVHNAETGEEETDSELQKVLLSIPEPSLRPAINLGSGRLVVVTASGLRLLNLGEKRVEWEFKRPVTIEDVIYHAEYPDECLVVSSSRANRWPGIAAVSLKNGQELWRFEKFKPASASVTVSRERNRFYIVYGQEQWRMIALQVREGLDGDKSIVEMLWPNEVTLGSFGGYLSGRVLVGGDSLFFLDNTSNSITVYDKFRGSIRGMAANAIGSFLVEKEDGSGAVLGGKLVIITDGGDCAFESADSSGGPPARNPLAAPSPAETPRARAESPPGAPSVVSHRSGDLEMSTLKEYLENPGALDNTTQLALQYFKGGDQEAAIDLLNRALLSENILLDHGTEKRFFLGYLLDGIKEEHMKQAVPRIAARRMRSAPAIDGDLGDAWDVASRTVMASPRNIGTIPGPGQARDWEGEEDLSAVLYTGWDDKYFYFALDV